MRSTGGLPPARQGQNPWQKLSRETHDSAEVYIFGNRRIPGFFGLTLVSDVAYASRHLGFEAVPS